MFPPLRICTCFDNRTRRGGERGRFFYALEQSTATLTNSLGPRPCRLKYLSFGVSMSAAASMSGVCASLSSVEGLSKSWPGLFSEASGKATPGRRGSPPAGGARLPVTDVVLVGPKDPVPEGYERLERTATPALLARLRALLAPRLDA